MSWNKVLFGLEIRLISSQNKTDLLQLVAIAVSYTPITLISISATKFSYELYNYLLYTNIILFCYLFLSTVCVVFIINYLFCICGVYVVFSCYFAWLFCGSCICILVCNVCSYTNNLLQLLSFYMFCIVSLYHGRTACLNDGV